MDFETASDMTGEKCNDCGRRYRTVYRIPDNVWSKVAPDKAGLGPHAEHQFGGLLCIDCASDRARSQGIHLYFEASIGDWRDNKSNQIEEVHN